MLNEISSDKVAYLIGFLAGDGNFSNGWGKRKDRLSVTTTDMEFVEWMNKNIVEFSIDNPKRNNNEKRNIFATMDSYVKTFPVAYSDDLNKYGVLCLKRDRAIRNISKKDMRHWLRGFMDADGHITFSMRKDRNRLAAKAGFTHPSEKMLGQIQTFLVEELAIPSAIKPKKGEECSTLHFSKLSDIKKFGDYIYSGGKDVVITRKYNTYSEMCRILADRVEQGTTYPKEFMDTIEYHELIGSFSSFMFVDGSGREYPSAKLIAEKHGIDKRLAHQRCRNGANGWTRRPKTETEKEEYKKYVNRQTKKKFKEWLENNPDFY